jgi:hypothetical protein
MEVPMTLPGVRGQENIRCWFGLFQEVGGGIREREYMMTLHVASPVPEQAWRADAKGSPLKLGEMLLQIILVTH